MDLSKILWAIVALGLGLAIGGCLEIGALFIGYCLLFGAYFIATAVLNGIGSIPPPQPPVGQEEHRTIGYQTGLTDLNEE